MMSPEHRFKAHLASATDLEMALITITMGLATAPLPITMELTETTCLQEGKEQTLDLETTDSAASLKVALMTDLITMPLTTMASRAMMNSSETANFHLTSPMLTTTSPPAATMLITSLPAATMATLHATGDWVRGEETWRDV